MTWSASEIRHDPPVVAVHQGRLLPVPGVDELPGAEPEWDNGQDDEAIVVPIFWPMLRDHVLAGHSIHGTLREVAWHAKTLGQPSQVVERRQEKRSACRMTAEVA